jgi:drug/metabolite transporter (DMT)-like permease
MQTAHLQLAGAMALVGINVAVAKLASPFLPVLIFMLVRFIVACLVLVPFAWREAGLRYGDLTRRDWGNLFLQSFFGVTLYTALLLYGVGNTSAMATGIITATVPAAIAGLAVLMLGERIGTRNLMALGLAVVGIAAVNAAGAQPGVAPNPALGNLMIAGSVLCEGLFAICAKRASAQLPIYRMSLAVNALGFATMAPFCIASAAQFDASTVPLWGWLLPVYYALTSSVIALVLWYRGMAALPASEAAIFTSTFPLTTVAVSVIFLGETVHWAHALGLICVLSAIYLGAAGARKAEAAG